MTRCPRRGFLVKSATLGNNSGLVVETSSGIFAANERISVDCIGVRNLGNSVMSSFAAEPDCEITHICDVRKSVRRQQGVEMMQKTGRMPKLVNDYRELLNDNSIDVFMLATPDHWHALLTIEFSLNDKDVDVENPASHNIREGKTLVAAVRRHDCML